MSDVIELLIGKLPTFDPAWTADVQVSFFKAFERITDMVDLRTRPQPEPELPKKTAKAVEPKAPAGTTNTGGRPSAVTEEHKAAMRRIAVDGGSNQDAVATTGLPMSTVTYYMARYRKEAEPTAPAAAPFRAGTDGTGSTNGGNHAR